MDPNQPAPKEAIWPRGYKTFFMLNSTEYKISTAHKILKFRQMKKFLA